MARFLALFVVALAIIGSTHAVDLQTFLTDPKYALLAAKATQAPSCLNDPAVTGTPPTFDLDLCPSLIAAMGQIASGTVATSISTECEPACAESLKSLSTQCLDELATAIVTDQTALGVVGARFLTQCNQVATGGGEAAEAPAPAMAPDMAVVEEAPAPMMRKLLR